jgi:restriction system protein
MRRGRQSGFDLLMSLPWQVGLATGILIWATAPYAAGFFANASPLFAISHQAVIGVLRILSYLCFGAATGSFLRGRFVAHHFDQQRSLEDLRRLTWQQFEVMVGEAFRRTGYGVVETGKGGADGGVDLVLKKAGQRFLVQCKHYRSTRVGVTIVREIYGVVAARRAEGAFVVTTGSFTKEATEFARSLPIELIDGARLEAMVREINA